MPIHRLLESGRRSLNVPSGGWIISAGGQTVMIITRGSATPRPALANCDAPDAQVVAWCWNEYAALAVADDGSYGYSSGPTTGPAEAAALSYCTGPNAHILCWVYSGSN